MSDGILPDGLATKSCFHVSDSAGMGQDEIVGVVVSRLQKCSLMLEKA